MSYDQRGQPDGTPESDSDSDGYYSASPSRAARRKLEVAHIQLQLSNAAQKIGLPQGPTQLISPYSAQGRAILSGSQWPLSESDDPSAPPLSPDYTPQATSLNFPQPSPLNFPQPSPSDYFQSPSSDYPQPSPLGFPQPSPDYPLPLPSDYLQQTSREYLQAHPNDSALSPSSYRSSRPLTTSSAASEASSLGSIPDFPVPQPPMPAIQANQQARRTPSLGPPPSARKGPSSYYTQISYVSPIAEESDTRSDVRSRHGSYASSNVFPSRTDDRHNSRDDVFSDDDSTITSDRLTLSPVAHEDRRNLVMLRQASLGRRTRPSLVAVGSVDSLGDKKNGKPSSENMKGVGSTLREAKAAYGLGLPLQEFGTTSLADRAGTRRPPKLDMDAVRDAEARGSLTSLPELIRRATRLAANLDRGKTASRLGLDFWEAGAPDKNPAARQSGFSDMLAAFPPPGHDTPNSRLSKWPSAGGNSRGGVTDSGMSNGKTKKQRKCCGMPLWTFITLLIVLLFIIAAAVVIPVVLIVIPSQNRIANGAAQSGQAGQGNDNGNNGNNNNNNNNGNNGNPRAPVLPAPTLAPGSNQCDGVITCQNGGLSILNSDRSCNCICINGFTGRTCTNNDATGCTTTNLAGAANNATMGTAISRLLGNAAGFNIPLNSTRVLSMFSQLSLSCAAQNALITFNGLASRSEAQFLQGVNVRQSLEPSRSLPLLHPPHPAKALELPEKRQAIGGPGSPDVKAAQPSAQPSPALTQPISSNVKALDFARMGVLFALQETGELNVAAKAQEAIQNVLTNNRNNGNAASSIINAGPFKMDLAQLTIAFNNGTTILAPQH
ncbi:hypothetical protein GQ44DRAFT_625005 [Phaeosphaeriaceae sp. PMI808]|nr:hypothetical protein GQ44DRAFT_625005 [Phaeosphaeriaceae sp. PMI808]